VQAKVGEAHGCDLAKDPGLPCEGLALGREGAAEELSRLASAEPVSDPVPRARSSVDALDPCVAHERGLSTSPASPRTGRMRSPR
jgi:hypothetical protein